MPRIDPWKLLRCLNPLLTPTGGIRAEPECTRLISLMGKFSNKLVSKCTYVNILMATKEELVVQFMGEGGWALLFQWLGHAISISDFAFIKVVLEFLIKCPINLDRLKENNCPKVIKGLSKDSEDPAVREMASIVVSKWLQFIKNQSAEVSVAVKVPSPPEQQLPKYKIMVRDGKSVLAMVGKTQVHRDKSPPLKPKFEDSDSDYEPPEPPPKRVAVPKPPVKVTESPVVKTKEKVREVEVKKEKPVVKHKHKESSDVRKKEVEKDVKDKAKHSSSSREKSGSNHKLSNHSKSDSHKSVKHSPSAQSSKSKSNNSNSSRDKDKETVSRDKNKEKETVKKEEVKSIEGYQSEKDKDSVFKLKTPHISCLGKIPKKTSSSTSNSTSSTLSSAPVVRPPESSNLPTAKKGSYSDESKRRTELKPSDRPKTVKTLPTKFRSTGLEEEAKPPPSKSEVKKKEEKRPEPSLKRSSPPPRKDSKEGPPPEKKSKVAEILEKREKLVERAGGIKLIPPKPKPVLLESDMFSDALTASTKEQPRKKKRRTSNSSSKDGEVKKEEENGGSSPKSPKLSASAASPPRESKPSLKFYRDTQEEPADLDDSINSVKKEVNDEVVDEPVEPPRHKLYPEGVLVVHRSRRAPKKSVRWRSDSELVNTRLFEMDETERVNVSRNFVDQKHMERSREREGFLMRKLGGSDMMEEKIPWGPLFIIDYASKVEPLKPTINSTEIAVQYAREKNVLQAIYFSRQLIPDSPSEPDPEIHPTTDPTIIPLDDGAENVSDHSNTPWPEPKPETEMVVNIETPIHLPPPNTVFTIPSLFPPQQGLENWRPPEDVAAVPGIQYPPQGPPMGPMFGMGQPPPFVAGGIMPPGPEGFNMAMFPGGFPMGPQDPSMFPQGPMGPMGPPPPGWGRGGPIPWGPRGPPPPLNMRNICRSWRQNGNCSRGNLCRFLHPGVNCPPLV